MVSSVSAILSGTQLVCLSKGQTLEFSKCNPLMDDKVCTTTTCQVCVSYNSNTKIFCPANPAICNAGGECTELYPPQSNQSLAQISITNIATTPSLPLSILFNSSSSTTQVNQNISLSFKTQVYPVNVTFILYNQNNTIHSQSTIKANYLSSIPVKYSLPSTLLFENYTLKATFSAYNKTSLTYTLGTISIQKVSAQNTTNSTSPQNTTNFTFISNFNTSPSFPLNIVANETYDNSTNITSIIYNKNLSISFDSSIYPINLTINLYNSTSNYNSKTTIYNSSSLPFIYSIPQNLSYGNYSLIAYIHYNNTLNSNYSIGTFSLSNSSIIEEPVPETPDQVITNTGGGGGGGGGSYKPVKNVSSTNLTNITVQNISTQNETNSSVKETEEKKYSSPITGAVIGTLSKRQVYIPLIVITVLLISWIAVYILRRK